jgi:hypothetical protein
MSEIQGIITNASIKAFNSGLAHGVVQERERITNLLTEIRNTWQKPVALNYPKELDSLIQLIQKGQQ